MSHYDKIREAYNEYKSSMSSTQETWDNVTLPKHYNVHPSGVECIEITQHMNFCLGNALKYIWRCADKGNTIEDLKKARWYIEREINRLENIKND